jgi:hypothetical protein
MGELRGQERGRGGSVSLVLKGDWETDGE